MATVAGFKFLLLHEPRYLSDIGITSIFSMNTMRIMGM